MNCGVVESTILNDCLRDPMNCRVVESTILSDCLRDPMNIKQYETVLSNRSKPNKMLTLYSNTFRLIIYYARKKMNTYKRMNQTLSEQLHMVSLC